MTSNLNIVDRLRKEIRAAKQRGLHVRVEPLEEGQSGWCQIGDKTILFIDAAHTAREQLSELHATIAQYRRQIAEIPDQAA